MRLWHRIILTILALLIFYQAAISAYAAEPEEFFYNEYAAEPEEFYYNFDFGNGTHEGFEPMIAPALPVLTPAAKGAIAAIGAAAGIYFETTTDVETFARDFDRWVTSEMYRIGPTTVEGQHIREMRDTWRDLTGNEGEGRPNPNPNRPPKPPGQGLPNPEDWIIREILSGTLQGIANLVRDFIEHLNPTEEGFEFNPSEHLTGIYHGIPILREPEPAMPGSTAWLQSPRQGPHWPIFSRMNKPHRAVIGNTVHEITSQSVINSAGNPSVLYRFYINGLHFVNFDIFQSEILNAGFFIYDQRHTTGQFRLVAGGMIVHELESHWAGSEERYIRYSTGLFILRSWNITFNENQINTANPFRGRLRGTNIRNNPTGTMQNIIQLLDTDSMPEYIPIAIPLSPGVDLNPHDVILPLDWWRQQQPAPTPTPRPPLIPPDLVCDICGELVIDCGSCEEMVLFPIPCPDCGELIPPGRPCPYCGDEEDDRSIWDMMRDFFDRTTEFFDFEFPDFTDLIPDLSNLLPDFSDIISNLFGRIPGFFGGILDWILERFSDVWGFISWLLDEIINFIIRLFVPSQDFWRHRFDLLSDSLNERLPFQADLAVIAGLRNITVEDEWSAFRIDISSVSGSTVEGYSDSISTLTASSHIVDLTQFVRPHLTIFRNIITALYMIFLVYYNYRQRMFLIRGTNYSGMSRTIGKTSRQD